jgi:DNA-binding IclR family transcriptional regulator
LGQPIFGVHVLQNSDDITDEETGSAPQRYHAPALEKGLDILELLARESEPLTVPGIVQKLGRSTGELFRMIQVLQHRGYVEQAPGNEGYRLTGKLFALGMDQPTVRNLVEIALPHMRRLSLDIGQSCHLAFHSQGQIVVVARMESSELIGFSVRIGYRRPLITTVSGAVLYAFQPDAIRVRWEEMFRPRLSKEDLGAFRLRANRILKKGYEQKPSEYVPGVIDTSAPIVRNGIAAAALTVPFLESTALARSHKESVAYIVRAAAAISSELLPNDQRA